MRRVVAVDLHAAFADLQQKLSVLGEFEDVSVAIAIAREPNIVIRIHGNAVLTAAGASIAIEAAFVGAGLALRKGRMQSAAIEPLVLGALGWSAPALDVFSVGSEFVDGRGGQVPVLRGIAFFQRVGAMQGPDVAMRVCSRAADAAEQH